MKNGNKILLGILTFVVVCVVGYALFSDTISVNGSATAKGDYEITTTCTPGISNELVQMGFATRTDELQHGFKNDSCEVQGNTITANAELTYPTARRFFTIKMTNSGSIPAIIWGADRGGQKESLSLDNSKSYSIKNIETDAIISSGAGEIRHNNHTFYPIQYFRMGVLSSQGNYNSNENVIYDSNKGYAGIKLNTGDSLFMIISYTYEDGLEKVLTNNGKSEYIEFKLNHEFKWEQFVDSPNYEEADFNNFCFDGC